MLKLISDTLKASSWPELRRWATALFLSGIGAPETSDDEKRDWLEELFSPVIDGCVTAIATATDD